MRDHFPYVEVPMVSPQKNERGQSLTQVIHEWATRKQRDGLRRPEDADFYSRCMRDLGGPQQILNCLKKTNDDDISACVIVLLCYVRHA